MDKSVSMVLIIYGMAAVIAFFVAFLIKVILMALKIKPKKTPTGI